MVTNMRIAIAESVGKIAVTHDAGARLFDLIHDPLARGEDVTLDFSGVSVYSSPFFNYAIGRLFADINPDVIKSHLIMLNISATGEKTIRSVVANASEYYGMTREQRAHLDEVNNRMIEDPDGDE